MGAGRVRLGLVQREDADSTTPYGTAPAIRDKRAGVLTDAYATHPERFARKPTRTATTADRIMDQPTQRHRGDRLVNTLSGASFR